MSEQKLNYFEELARRQGVQDVPLLVETSKKQTINEYTIVHTFEIYPYQELHIKTKWHIGDYWTMQLVIQGVIFYEAVVLGEGRT